MVASCIVEHCKSYFLKNNVAFYRIPSVISGKNKNYKSHLDGMENIILSSQNRRDAWLKILRCKSLTAVQLKNVRVCSEHFCTGNFVN